ncbi:MAG: putative lipid II flippase FtsW [Bacillati bacterium ANGP1]|uniref:Probable peptidoglycan glycosyltransferase FtsW n=3 Tax=Candidatus Segetimicrobium genomatis TaxID=2569760 RepID=A0A537LRD0_9BACT|nr:MAG: putative lipid II flippase FtsW [Terrabacteria group bacterium ANGP1]
MDIVPKRAPDSWLFCAVVALVATGVVMVYSASAIVAQDRYGDGAFFFKRQVAWAGLGMMALLIMQRTQYARLRRLTPWLLIMAILSLTLVLMPGIGRVAGGARRWIVLAGPFAFQPAEGAKLALALYLAHVLTKRGPGLGDPRAVSSPLLVTTLISGLILLQPDMGTSLLVALLAAAVFFIGGVRLVHLLGLSMASIPLLTVAALGEEYRRQRLLAFLDPWRDPQGAGFHIIQSLLALGSGGVLGLGLGESRQKFFYLPERHTDFIFAILGEELGLIGTVAVLVLFGILAVRGLRIAREAPDRYGSLVAGGITLMIVLQAIINIGVTTGVLPITGVPLPFVSFGGSSLLFAMMGMGIVLNISQYCGSPHAGFAGSGRSAGSRERGNMGMR